MWDQPQELPPACVAHITGNVASSATHAQRDPCMCVTYYCTILTKQYDNTVDRDALQCALSSRHMHAHTCKKLASCSHLEVLLTSVSSESESESGLHGLLLVTGLLSAAQ